MRHNGIDRTLYNLGQAPPVTVAHRETQGGSDHNRISTLLTPLLEYSSTQQLWLLHQGFKAPRLLDQDGHGVILTTCRSLSFGTPSYPSKFPCPNIVTSLARGMREALFLDRMLLVAVKAEISPE